MARPTKTTSTAEVQEKVETTQAAEVQEKVETAKADETPEVPAYADNIMKLYPQYEEMWITPEGFVHPVGVPEYVHKGATLYKNKYFNK